MTHATKILKNFLFAISLLAIPVRGFCQFSAVSYYVVAHQNQWQLFMGNKTYNDIIAGGKNGPNTKVVIIYTTAGDESCNGNPVNVPYYLSRQAGANHCVEFCADQFGQHQSWTVTNDTVLGHSILKTQYKNVTGYCLKLTGGCHGMGFRQQSLTLLKNGSIPVADAVDSSTEYSGWQDLTATVQAIIGKENQGIPAVFLNTADTDQVLNPGDHPDNIATGYLALGATEGVQPLAINLYREYATANLPVNVPNKDIATKAALLSLLDYGRTEQGQPSEWSPSEIAYTARCYFRTITKQ